MGSEGNKMDRVEISIDEEGHLFRLPSEFDPTKKKSKGGFLNGEIELPFYPRMKVTLSSYPSEELLAEHPELGTFSPCLLYNSRKKGGQLLYRRMYVPFLQHFQQQLLVDNGSVFIKSSPSKFDEARTDMDENIPEWDKLFDLNTKDMKLRLGRTDKSLNIQVILSGYFLSKYPHIVDPKLHLVKVNISILGSLPQD